MKKYIDAYDWYELQQPNLGNRFMKSVESKLSQIILNPEYYNKKDHLRFREAKVENFPFKIVCMNFFREKKQFM